MITEDYVSFETAKLLKEKGFDEPVRQYYNHEKNLSLMVSRLNWNKTELFHSSPTLQMVMKWLREAHHIVITTAYANICGLGFTYVATVIKINDNHEIEEGPGLNVCVYGVSYEEACELAIKYCLENLI